MLSSFGVSSPMTLRRREAKKTDDRGLTMLDREILVCMANGMNLQEQADFLGYSPASVETHRVNLYKKLGVRNGAAAVAWGFKNKYLI